MIHEEKKKKLSQHDNSWNSVTMQLNNSTHLVETTSLTTTPTPTPHESSKENFKLANSFFVGP